METAVLRKEGALTGISLGVILTVLTIAPMYYYVSSTSFWTVIIGPVITGFLFPLVVAVLFTFSLRKKVGGYWNFREAVTGIFIMLLVATLISSVAGVVFEQFVEPTMKERYMRNIANNSIAYMEKSNVPQEKIDEQLEKIDEQIDQMGKSNPLTMLRGLGVSVIVAFVVALIFAALFKKEKPVFNLPEQEETDQL